MTSILCRPQCVNLTACCWLCTTMVALACWVTCTRRVARADIYIVARSSKCVSGIRLKWEMKLWTVTRVIMWLLCDHGVEWSSDWVFSAHFIHLLNNTMPVPCTDVHPDVTLLTQACWAVRLWISGRGLTMCSKCHTCMPVCKMYNPCTMNLTPQPCGKPPKSGPAVLLDMNGPVCFSILQK